MSDTPRADAAVKHWQENADFDPIRCLLIDLELEKNAALYRFQELRNAFDRQEKELNRWREWWTRGAFAPVDPPPGSVQK
jgi:hypothetical protein